MTGKRKNAPSRLSNQAIGDVNTVQRDAEQGLANSKIGESSSSNVTSDIRSFREKSKLTQEKSAKFRASSGKNLDSVSNFTHVSQEGIELLSTLQQTFVVSDATKPDFPITYASAGFFSMTGYAPDEVIGRNCRFLQGPDTDQIELSKIRESVKTGKSYCGRLLNYRKNGSRFWNLLTITSVFDDRGEIIKFIGMQVEVSKYTEGLNDKALRPNALPLSLIRYDVRQKDNAKSSITEVVHIVKNSCLDIQTTSQNSTDSAIKDNADNDNPKPHGKDNLIGVRSPSKIVGGTSDHNKNSRKSLRGPGRSLLGFKDTTSNMESTIENEILLKMEDTHKESWEDLEREKDIRQAIDLATTLERIEKNFVITDVRLPDNPIIFASDSFLELTEYTREEILGRNCRFLQGPETDPTTVSKIRDAVRDQKEVTVQLINYTKSGRKFWNLFHLQPMHDQKGELQYFIGVQLDGSGFVEPILNRLPEKVEIQSSKMVKDTAEDIDEAVRVLPDANLRPEGLWEIHSQPVIPRPHKKNNASWTAIQKVIIREKVITLSNFKPIKPLGCGDTGSVHLVELMGTGELFAMKIMDKDVMLNRNKVHRVCLERQILSLLDHPFLPSLYTSFQIPSHVCLVTDFYSGGELFALLDRQPMKIFDEAAARFYAAEVVVGLEYLHCLGIIYRDLKPENILLQKDGHIALTDFDLSFLSSCKPQVIKHTLTKKDRKVQKQAFPIFFAEPTTQSNSFVGTEEYVAPEVIEGSSQTSAIDWWTLGILLYEMLYGRTPFRGKNRQQTFNNILHKDLTFPSSIPVSLTARQLICKLLQRQPSNRLGSNSGSNEIKQHQFFQEINWPLIRCMKPPRLKVPLQLTESEPNYKTTDGEDFNIFETI